MVESTLHSIDQIQLKNSKKVLTQKKVVLNWVGIDHFAKKTDELSMNIK